MQKFVATGRVHFLPMSNHEGGGVVTSILNPDRQTQITVRRRLVDATYLEAKVPSVIKPRYDVDADVELIPPNGLSGLRDAHRHHVVVGAGKTAFDAILFLLDRGVPADAITWVMPHDAWLWAREPMQPGIALAAILRMVRASAELDTPDEIFLSLERQGVVHRLDPDSLPTKWRCASVSLDEVVKLRSIGDLVRKGRVTAVAPGRLVLERGEHAVPADSLFIDCTANGLTSSGTKPIFSAEAITLQSAFMCQQTFSASLIGRLEAARMTDVERNAVLTPIPHPELKEHLAACMLTSADNMVRYSRRFPWWLRRNRLFFGHHEATHRFLAGFVTLLRLQRHAAHRAEENVR